MKLVAILNALLLGIVTSLNSLNTPWVAITVIVLGMKFAIVSHRSGLPSDIASGIIGAGVGLLTGQALALYKQHQGDPLAAGGGTATPLLNASEVQQPPANPTLPH